MYTVFPISAIKAVSIVGHVLKAIIHLSMLTFHAHIRIPINYGYECAHQYHKKTS